MVMSIALWCADHTARWVLVSLTVPLVASLLCKLSLVLLSEMILMQSSSAKPLLSVCTGVAGGKKALCREEEGGQGISMLPM